MKARASLSNSLWAARRFGIALLVAALFIFIPLAARAQEPSSASQSGPETALLAALGAACRANQSEFARYLTADNAAAFLALPADQRDSVLKRFSLSETPGKTLSSTGTQGHPVLRCQSPGQTAEFRLGDVRTHENLSFISVSVTDSEQTQFGMVRENGGWRLLSLGLVLLDIPQLAKQWGAANTSGQEDAAVAALRQVAQAVHSYRRSFGRLPESLAQLGPAPKDEISPDQASLLDAQLAAGSAAGYHFRYRIVPAPSDADATFELAATPDEYGKTGQQSFFLDSGGRIHGADKHGTVAVPDDPLIAGEKAP